MSAIILLLFLLSSTLIVDETTGAQYFGRATSRNNKCYYAKKKLLIAPGDSVFLAGCKEMRCIKQLNKFYLETDECGAVEKHCRIPGDKNAPYPLCCPRNGCSVE